jgi:diketogulonate reductase-like aldo/keto reductase
VIPIIGARKIAQLEDNLSSLEAVLTPDQVKTLDQASAIDLGFPYSMYQIDFAQTLRYGGMRDRILG